MPHHPCYLRRIAIFTIAFNLVVDVLYAVVDPRVRYD